MIKYLVAAAAVVAAMLWGTRPRRTRLNARWRIASSVLAIAAVAAAAWVAVRGELMQGALLIVIGLLLALGSRWPRPSRAVALEGGGMSLEEARAMLGVGEGAGPTEIQAAYARLMRRAHPDHGGSTGLATQLNLARERLLKG